MNDPFTIHWFPLISHDVEQLDLPCHQFVFWTHLRLRQWRCSRLCWCPACREAFVSWKWFAHWQCILCWQRPIVFTVWWINGVDRLTCSHCDTLGNNILKQLLKSQPDITWNRFPSTPGEVQNLSCQKIERCTKQMKRMHVRNENDHGKLDAQTSQAGFVQQQCYCKHSTHEEIRESVRVKYVWVVNQWWIRMIFHRKFCIPKICSPRSIQATHAHACHSEVSIRLIGSFWFLVSKAICRGILQQRPRSNEELPRLRS